MCACTFPSRPHASPAGFPRCVPHGPKHRSCRGDSCKDVAIVDAQRRIACVGRAMPARWAMHVFASQSRSIGEQSLRSPVIYAILSIRCELRLSALRSSGDGRRRSNRQHAPHASPTRSRRVPACRSRELLQTSPIASKSGTLLPNRRANTVAFCTESGSPAGERGRSHHLRRARDTRLLRIAQRERSVLCPPAEGVRWT